MPDAQQFETAVARLIQDREPFSLTSSRWQLWCLCGAVQLACRHPGFTGPTRLVAEQWARQVLTAITADDRDLRLLSVMGWHQNFDHFHHADGYTLSSDGRLIICHRCGLSSSNPGDISQRYCGHCHRFHEDPQPGGAS